LRRGISLLIGGHLNGFFAPRGGNLKKPIFESSNAPEVALGGGDVEASI